MSNIDELERLSALWRDGTLTEQEFSAQKAKLLSTQAGEQTPKFLSQNRMMVVGAAILAVLAGSYFVSRTGRVGAQQLSIEAPSPGPIVPANTATAQPPQSGSLLLKGDQAAFISPFSSATRTGTYLSLQMGDGGENSEIGSLYVRPQGDLALLSSRTECGSSCGDQYTVQVFSIIFPVGTRLPRYDDPGEIIVDGRSFEAYALQGEGAVLTWPRAEIGFVEPYLSVDDRSHWTAENGTELEQALRSAKSIKFKFKGASYEFPVDPSLAADESNAN